MNTANSIWCLHGNLQLPEVWKPFQHDLLWPLIAVDIFAEGVNSMDTWVEDFCAKVARSSLGQKQVLIGYSLGGRLAMQALVKAPDLWKAVIIVSADPGHYGPEDKEKQLLFDQGWGARFATDDWETLLDDWNSLSVFCGIENPVPPKESDFDRQSIASAFDKFSKGRQSDLTLPMESMKLPSVLYVSGELDTKYNELGAQLEKMCGCVTHRSVTGAGHRVPWEKPEEWCEAVNAFLECQQG